MHRTLLASLVLTLAAACGSDNASPHTQGAHNAPSKGGETKSNTPPPGNPDPSPQPAGAEGTYGESGATPGGAQRAPSK